MSNPATLSAMTVADPPRCDRCGWTLVDDPANGCAAGNCSMRPLPPKRLSVPERYDLARGQMILDAANDTLATLRAENSDLRTEAVAYRVLLRDPMIVQRQAEAERDAAVAAMDEMAAEMSGRRDEASAAHLARAITVVSEFIKHHGNELSASYSNTAKQESWQALRAWAVEVGR